MTIDTHTLFSNFFKSEKNKQHIEVMVKPLINIILNELNPYIYATITFICIIFLLILCIFILQIKFYIASLSLRTISSH